MTIASDLLDALNAGYQYIDDIVTVTGHTNPQIYFASRELIKNKKATSPIGGQHGAVVLVGTVFKRKPELEETSSAPAVVEPPVVEEPKKKEVVFDFNDRINAFVDNMAGVIVNCIENRVQEELKKVTSTVEAKVIAAIKSSSEDLLDRVGKQLTAAIATHSTVASVIQPNLTTAVEKHVEEHFEQTVGQQAPKAPTVKETRVRLPRVAVCNLKPIQCGELATEFSETFDISFWNGHTGSGNSQLYDIAKNCVAVFWHVKHSSHSAEDILKNQGANLIRVNGDLSAMRAELTKYYEQTKQPV